MLPLIGCLLLWFWPSWRRFVFIGFIIALLTLGWSFANFVQNGALKVATATEILWALATETNVGWNVGPFAVVGAIIVWVRGAKSAGA